MSDEQRVRVFGEHVALTVAKDGLAITQVMTADEARKIGAALIGAARCASQPLPIDVQSSEAIERR